MFGIVGLAFVGAAVVAWWRQNRRFGAAFVNRVVNPALVRRRLAGSGRSEIGTLEHIGRTTGTRRLTPVHPEPTVDGFRIIVPLGPESQWARNVLAAGHCRLQLHDTVYDLDEPTLLTPEEIEGLPRLVQRIESYLGFRYLALRTFASAHGELTPEAETYLAGEPAFEPAPTAA
jgi:hypothetical protein